MRTQLAEPPQLEAMLAQLLQNGTWIACAVVGLGLLFELCGWDSNLQYSTSVSSLGIVKTGVAMFILLPVLRVTLMLIVFIKQRDHIFVFIAATVLMIIFLGLVLGMRMSGTF